MSGCAWYYLMIIESLEAWGLCLPKDGGERGRRQVYLLSLMSLSDLWIAMYAFFSCEILAHVS